MQLVTIKMQHARDFAKNSKSILLLCHCNVYCACAMVKMRIVWAMANNSVDLLDFCQEVEVKTGKKRKRKVDKPKKKQERKAKTKRPKGPS